MLFKSIDKLSNRAFAAVKWFMTAFSGLLTAGLIFMLES